MNKKYWKKEDLLSLYSLSVDENYIYFTALTSDTYLYRMSLVSNKIERISDEEIIDFVLGEKCIYYNNLNTYKLDKFPDSKSELFYDNESVFPGIGNTMVFEDSYISNGWYISARDNQSEIRFTCKKEDGAKEFELFKDIDGIFRRT